MSTLAAFTPDVVGEYDARLPRSVVDCPGVPGSYTKLFAVLDGFAWKTKDYCFPSYQTVAGKLGRSVDHVRRMIRTAVKAGWLGKRARSDGSRGFELVLPWKTVRNRLAEAALCVRRLAGACAQKEGAGARRKRAQAPTEVIRMETEKKTAGTDGPAAQGPPSVPAETEEDLAAARAKIRAEIHRPPPGPPPKDPAPVSPRASLPAAAAPGALEAAESRRRELAAQLASLGVKPRPGPAETPREPGTAMEGYVPPFHPKE